MPYRDPRSWGLTFMAGACASRCFAYLPGRNEQLPVGLREVAQVMPVWIYSVLWGLATVGLIVVASMQWPPRWWRAFLVAPAMLWGGMYFMTWLSDRTTNGLSSAFLFWMLAGGIACFILEPPKRRR